MTNSIKLKDLGPLKFFLGLEIARSAKGIHLCHRKYTLEFMEEAEVLASKPAKFPMDQNCRLSKTVVSYYKMLLSTGG